jgi:hypothetical protein
MSSPCELITVWCPCGCVYDDSWRASMNLSLDHFDEAYIDLVSSTTCPECGLKTRLGSMLVRFDNDRCTLQFTEVPKPLPVILYRERWPFDQPETVKWIKEWLRSKGRQGILELLGILERSRNGHPNSNYLDPLSHIVAGWMMDTKCEEPERWNRLH